jgi:dTDP-4-amino-4,6-dideoxy-D-galactose acyltransferase
MNNDAIHGQLDYLQWESEFFFQPTAKLTLDSAWPLLTRKALSAYPLVQVKVPAADSSSLDALYYLGFQLVEGEIDFALNVPDAAIPVTSCQLAVAQDIVRVSQLAGSAFQLSRFRAPWYQPRDAGRFYALWAEKAILGTFDSHCLLLNAPDGQLLGFVTLRADENHSARIGLLAVQPQATGRGIGKQLIHAAWQWCREHNIAQLKVATQTGNIAALNLYRTCGGVLTHSAYWLYR